MAKYDYITPKDIIAGIKQKKKKGYFVQRLNDKKHYAQYLEVICKDKRKAHKIYDEIRSDLQKPLPKSSKGSSKQLAKFLRDLQIKETGSFVEQPNSFALEVERAKHILRNLKMAGLKPKYPLKFLNKVNTGKKLKTYFKSLLYDFSKNNGDELNLAITGLPTIKDLDFHPFSKDWERAYFECIEMWQDPKTGYWGPWIKKGKKIVKLPELSTTFHILRIYYNKETLQLNNPKYDLKHKRKLIKTTWEIKNRNYPYGWLEKGNWSTHHNFDVAEIFLYLFKLMDKKGKQKVRSLFHRFLKWNLTNNFQKNGGFIGHYPDKKEPTMLSTNMAILNLRGTGYFSKRYREEIWDGVRLPVNSYRVYSKKPENDLNTSDLKSIIYIKKTTPDPLDTRQQIYEYWKNHKSENPSEAININKTLKFEEFPPKKIQIKRLKKLPRSGSKENVVKVDKYGWVLN